MEKGGGKKKIFTEGPLHVKGDNKDVLAVQHDQRDRTFLLTLTVAGVQLSNRLQKTKCWSRVAVKFIR